MHASSEPNVETPENPNDTSISDAKTQSGDEHEPNDNANNVVHVDAQPSNNNDIEIEPAIVLDNPQSRNQRYDKRDFVARKHGREREPWVQKPMPFPPNPSKKKNDEDLECFAKMIRPIFLRMCFTDMLKMPTDGQKRRRSSHPRCHRATLIEFCRDVKKLILS